jgi:hypothetical protein
VTDGERDIRREIESDARDIAESTRMECGFCGVTTPDTDSAIEMGWIPEFWLDDDNPADRPACSDCASEHLDDLDADPIIKPGHEIYLCD